MTGAVPSLRPTCGTGQGRLDHLLAGETVCPACRWQDWWERFVLGAVMDPPRCRCGSVFVRHTCGGAP